MAGTPLDDHVGTVSHNHYVTFHSYDRSPCAPFVPNKSLTCAQTAIRAAMGHRGCPVLHTTVDGVCRTGQEPAVSRTHTSAFAHATWRRVQNRTCSRQKKPETVRICTRMGSVPHEFPPCALLRSAIRRRTLPDMERPHRLRKRPRARMAWGLTGLDSAPEGPGTGPAPDAPTRPQLHHAYVLDRNPFPLTDANGNGQNNS